MCVLFSAKEYLKHLLFASREGKERYVDAATILNFLFRGEPNLNKCCLA